MSEKTYHPELDLSEYGLKPGDDIEHPLAWQARRLIIVDEFGDVSYRVEKVVKLLRRRRVGKFSESDVRSELKRISPGAKPLAVWLASPFQMDLFG